MIDAHEHRVQELGLGTGLGLGSDTDASPSPCPSSVTSLGAFKVLLTQRASQGTHWTLSERVAVEVAYILCHDKYTQQGAILLANDHPQQMRVRSYVNTSSYHA